MATNTGGVRWDQKPDKPPPDLKATVAKLRISMPLMKYLMKDGALRQLVIMSLVKECKGQGQSIVVPAGMMVQSVSEEQFNKAMDSYAGLHDNNVDQVVA